MSRIVTAIIIGNGFRSEYINLGIVFKVTQKNISDRNRSVKLFNAAILCRILDYEFGFCSADISERSSAFVIDKPYDTLLVYDQHVGFRKPVSSGFNARNKLRNGQSVLIRYKIFIFVIIRVSNFYAVDCFSYIDFVITASRLFNGYMSVFVFIIETVKALEVKLLSFYVNSDHNFFSVVVANPVTVIICFRYGERSKDCTVFNFNVRFCFNFTVIPAEVYSAVRIRRSRRNKFGSELCNSVCDRNEYAYIVRAGRLKRYDVRNAGFSALEDYASA